MTKINLSIGEFEIKENLKELSLREYNKIMAINSEDSESEIEKVLKMVEVISTIPNDQLYDLTNNDVNSLTPYISAMMPTFATYEPTEDLQIGKIVELSYNDKTYSYLIADFNNLTMRSMSDLEYLNKVYNSEIDNLLNVLCIGLVDYQVFTNEFCNTYKPVIKKQDPSYYVEKREVLLQFDVESALKLTKLFTDGRGN